MDCLIFFYTFTIFWGERGTEVGVFRKKMKNGKVQRKKLDVPVPTNFSSDLKELSIIKNLFITV